MSLNKKYGINKMASVKGIDPNKTAPEIVNASMNQREAINITWWDIFIFRYC